MNRFENGTNKNTNKAGRQGPWHKKDQCCDNSNLLSIDDDILKQKEIELKDNKLNELGRHKFAHA
jgi:hypothetical protein